MNKKLLAVAVVGALASPAAFAQGTPTTLYGIFDMGYQNASGADNRNKSFFQQGMRDPSRFGIKGSEDLEAGMYAMYGFEFNMVLDTGSPTDISRVAFVGLGSKQWGELTFGRQYTHLFHTFAVGSAHAYGTFSSAFSQTPVSTRASNAMKYSSPVFNGFSIGALWSPSDSGAGAGAASSEPFNATDKANYFDGAIRWTPGPFGVAAAYGKNKLEGAAGSSLENKITELSANWDNKAFGIYGNYATQKSDATAGGVSVTPNEWKTYSISGVARFAGRHELYLMTSKVKNDKVTNMEATTYGITYENVMSKRTRLYVGYGQTKNKDAAGFAPTAYAFATPGVMIPFGAGTSGSDSNSAIPNGKDPKAFQIGISHSF